MSTSRTITRRVRVPGRFKRWSAVQARDALAAATKSGLSLAAFASRESLPLHRLRWWRVRLKGVSKQEAAAVRFVPVTIRPTPSSPAPVSGLEVEIRGGRVIRVTGLYDPDALAHLVRALEVVGC